MCMHVNKCSFRKAGQVVLEIKIISMAKTLLRGFGEKINISIAFSMNCYPLELLTPSSGDRTCTQSSALWEIVVSGSCDLCWTWRPSQGLLGFISFQLFHYVGLLNVGIQQRTCIYVVSPMRLQISFESNRCRRYDIVKLRTCTPHAHLTCLTTVKLAGLADNTESHYQITAYCWQDDAGW